MKPQLSTFVTSYGERITGQIILVYPNSVIIRKQNGDLLSLKKSWLIPNPPKEPSREPSNAQP